MFPDTDYGQDSCRKPEDMYLFHMVQFYDILSVLKANYKSSYRTLQPTAVEATLYGGT